MLIFGGEIAYGSNLMSCTVTLAVQNKTLGRAVSIIIKCIKFIRLLVVKSFIGPHSAAADLPNRWLQGTILGLKYITPLMTQILIFQLPSTWIPPPFSMLLWCL